MTEAETLRQCDKTVLRNQVSGGDSVWRRCGESIAQVGETWEHVERCCDDPPERHHEMDDPPADGLWCSDCADVCESPQLVVPRGHQAIPGEER